MEAERERALADGSQAARAVKEELTWDSVFGFVDYNRGLSELADTDDSAAAAIWAITLLLMMVEVAPVLVKAISPLGPYDHRITAEYGVSKETVECETRTKSEVRQAFLGKYAEVAKAVFDTVLDHRLNEFRRRLDAFDPETDADVTRLLASLSRYIGGRESVIIIPELAPPLHSRTVRSQPEIDTEPMPRPPADAPGNRFSRALFLCAPVPCFFSLLVVAVMTGSLETGIGAASLLLTMWTSYFGIPRASAPRPETV